MMSEKFQMARLKTIEWIKDGDLCAFDGYLVGEILREAMSKYYQKTVYDYFGQSDRLWRASQEIWLTKVAQLGGPDSLLAAIQSVD